MGKIKDPLEIKQLPYSRLLKIEVPALVKSVIDVVERHNPEELQIKEIYDLLLEQNPLIKKLDAIHGVHPLTLELKPLREHLLLQVSALKLQLRLASKMKTEKILAAASLLNLSVDAYLSRLRSNKNEQVILEKITGFLDELNEDLELSLAVETLDLSDLIKRLKSSLSQVKGLISERNALISQRPKEKTNETAKTVIRAMKYLFKQIEVAQLMHPKLDYKPLLHELNDTLALYRKLINMRVGFYKKKAEEKQNNELAMATSTVVEAAQPNVVTSSAVMNELSKDFEQKQAVDTSAKQLQLLDLKNEPIL